MSVLCDCSCKDGQEASLGLGDYNYEVGVPRPTSRARECGLVSFNADVDLPLLEPPTREGEVWHLRPEEGNAFQRARLLLYTNGFAVRYPSGSGALGADESALAVSWSPFSLVQACRLHSVHADAQQPWLRLFKVSVFHHGVTQFFATQGPDADTERARWVADISRALRNLTQSLFPPFSLRAEPLPGAGWTAMRLLAGYLLLCDDRGVSLVYCELHSHWDGAAAFAAYEDEHCDVQVVRLSVDKDTCVSERVGIDCSCFSLGGHHFNTRSCAEKMLWLRAISNVKVKLRHRATNPTPTDLRHYRAAVLEYAAGMQDSITFHGPSRPMLPHRGWRRSVVPVPAGATVPLDGLSSPLSGGGPSSQPLGPGGPGGHGARGGRAGTGSGPPGGFFAGGAATASLTSSQRPEVPGGSPTSGGRGAGLGPALGLGGPLLGLNSEPVPAEKPSELDFSPGAGAAPAALSFFNDPPPAAPPPAYLIADSAPPNCDSVGEADAAAGAEMRQEILVSPGGGGAARQLPPEAMGLGSAVAANRVASLPAGSSNAPAPPGSPGAGLRRAPSTVSA